MKIAVVTCYKDPDYVRARTIRAGLDVNNDVRSFVIKNKRTGVARYPEVLFNIFKSRFTIRPDIYILTFRGYEILPFMAIMTWPKPLIYDEFINPIEWLNEPREESWARKFPTDLLRPFYKLLLSRCRLILTDTEAHSKYSAKLMGISEERFVTIPVSTDETVFKPTPRSKTKNPSFKVFYYGNMLPLHGLKYVLEAALLLKDHEDIEFLLVGGKHKAEDSALAAKTEGARVVYRSWIPFNKLPRTIADSDLCLAGPFGDTTQANHVITGKAYQFLAMGASVLIGESKASKNLLFDEVNCLSVPQADAKALANKIVWAATHREQLLSIGLEGRNTYNALFSNAVVAEKLKKVLASLA